MRGVSQADQLRRIAAYGLLGVGGLTVILALPLWFWLAALGAGLVAVGWYLLGTQ